MKRLFAPAANSEQAPVFYISCRCLFKGNLFIKKSVLLRVFEDGVDSADKVRLGTPVVRERIAGVDVPGRPHVSEKIGSTEAVDGLLGIADKKERSLSASEDVLKDGVLDRVCVLKLVDEGGTVTFPDVADEISAARSL